ncbi:hypothetical protein [Thalassospira profundimaris]|uniref:hypothetical protein n=1 Tax=Thalassospira profundimaris TaxID=502049 RepID=UPI001EE636EC|nr:hypothetical protein [Thalassospira profundimaris]
MDSTTISTVVQTISSISSLLGTAISARDETKRSEAINAIYTKLTEANGHALQAQSELSNALKRVDELSREIEKHNSWKADIARYRMKDFGDETFAWVLRDDTSDGVPPHKICPTCVSSHKISVLQSEGLNRYAQKRYKCSVCKNEINLGPRGKNHGNQTTATMNYKPDY